MCRRVVVSEDSLEIADQRHKLALGDRLGTVQTATSQRYHVIIRQLGQVAVGVVLRAVVLDVRRIEMIAHPRDLTSRRSY